MTVQDMLDNLGLRLEDPDKKAFPESFRLQCLDDGQIILASLFPNDLLSTLEVLDSSQSLSSSKVLLSALTYDVLKGVMGVVAVKNTSGLWCNHVGLRDLKKTESGLHTPSRQNPSFYNFAGTIFPLPTSLTAIDAYYLKMPSPLRHAFTIATSASTSEFAGDLLQGLSLIAGVYNGSVIYNLARNTYHIITDYAVTTRTFTVAPVRSTGTWVDDTFYFVTHDWFLINLNNVTSELDESYHEIIISLAEVECWMRKNQLDRANKALASAYEMIQAVVSQRLENTGIGEY